MARFPVTPNPWCPVLALLAALLGSPVTAHGQFNGDFSLQPHTLDAENFLDWKAYQPPLTWREDVELAPNYFRGTVGSLSQKVFYTFHELRLEKSLGEYGSVHYRQHEDSFYRADPIYQEFELRLGRDYSVALIGFPRHQKVLGAVGVALAAGSRTDPDYVRLSWLNQYRLFNEEHEGDEYFDPDPILYRLEARTHLGEQVLLRVHLREEQPATLISPSGADPTLAKREDYRGRKAELLLEARWSDWVTTGLDLRTEQERRARAPYGGSSTVVSAAQALRYVWADAYVLLSVSGGNRLELGAYYGEFRNQIDSEAAGEDFRHRLLTAAAYAFWDWPRSSSFLWRFSLQVGRANLLTVDEDTPANDEAERGPQLKAGVGVVLHQAGSYAVFFNSTWDLDLFAHRQWDGGNIQVQWLF